MRLEKYMLQECNTFVWLTEKDHLLAWWRLDLSRNEMSLASRALFNSDLIHGITEQRQV